MAEKISYWERRKATEMYEYMEEAEAVADQIAKLYLKASRYISTQADDIFEKYMTKHKLTRDEALQLINTLQDRASLDELLEKLQNGTKDKSKKELLSELEAPAYRARLERLEQLQNQLDYVMKNIYQQEKTFTTSHYVDLANEAYYREIFDVQQQIGAAFSFHVVDPQVIDKVINSRWSGENYSKRIWKNTQALAQDLKEELLINLVTGRTNREAAEIIQSKFAAGASAARRLIRTESNYVATELNFKAYEECGIEKYRFCAVLDLRTSETCRKLDRKIFPVSERATGVNCPPMHPWCRSTTIEVITEELANSLTRKARDPVAGEIIHIPASMTYQEWYDKYVKGNPEAELAEKQIKNRSSDRKQHKKYREILGDEIPEELDEFQRMKYTEGEKWKFMKLDYRRRNELLQHPEWKLPNAENVVLPEAKFTKYLLGGENAKGLAKGKAFTERLGYNIDNWKELQREITNGAEKYPATSKGETEYGVKYEQKMVLYGKNNTPANVVVGWMCKPDGIISMSSAYIKEVK